MKFLSGSNNTIHQEIDGPGIWISILKQVLQHYALRYLELFQWQFNVLMQK